MTARPDLAALRKLLNESSPRPWSTNDRNDVCSGSALIAELNYNEYKTHAALIVAAVNALPALLDQIHASDALIKLLQEQLAKDGDRINDLQKRLTEAEAAQRVAPKLDASSEVYREINQELKRTYWHSFETGEVVELTVDAELPSGHKEWAFICPIDHERAWLMSRGSGFQRAYPFDCIRKVSVSPVK